MAGRHFGGYVLAGGRSSRMGTDKALLMLDGRTLLERAAEAVEAAAGNVAVVCDPERYPGLPFEKIPDEFPEAGPLAGIHAALRHSARDWNLVVACDMPGLDAIELRDLLRQTSRFPDAQVLLPEAEGKAQPLCAVYRRSALAAIDDALKSDRRRILDVLSQIRVERLRGHSAEMFQNVNTPQDWDAIASRCPAVKD